MDGFNIVMVIAIILFARLGARLVFASRQNKKERKRRETHTKEDSDKKS